MRRHLSDRVAAALPNDAQGPKGFLIDWSAWLAGAFSLALTTEVMRQSRFFDSIPQVRTVWLLLVGIQVSASMLASLALTHTVGYLKGGHEYYQSEDYRGQQQPASATKSALSRH